MKILSVAGARPNFMKLAAIAQAIGKFNKNIQGKSPDAPIIDHVIVHTGQHYDKKMSLSFFEDLSIPKPDINLEVGSGSHAQQTAEIMKRFEPVLLKEKPDFILVVGDVNSTIACTLVASKIQYENIKSKAKPTIVHVEAGLRSFDRSMPEEINRILTDSISDLLFVTEKNAVDNLRREGISEDKIFFVGNVMIDTLKQHLHTAEQSLIKEKLNINQPYALVTLHRPSNVDDPEILQRILESLLHISKDTNLIFPVHPRTMNSIKENGLSKFLECDRIQTASPLGYLDFLNLVKNAKFILTDSGGLQEESTYLGIPCVTLRENTERPVTVEEGSNYLTGTDSEKILSTVRQIIEGRGKDAKVPSLWDGGAGDRIISVLTDFFRTAA